MNQEPGSAYSREAARHASGAVRTLTLLAVDALALLVSGLAAHAMLGLAAPRPAGGTFWPLAALVPIFTCAYAAAGLYPGFGVSAIQMIRATARQTSLVFLVIATSVLVLRLPGSHARATLVAWWALALPAVPLARAVLSWLAVAAPWWREPVIFVGDGARLASLAATLGRARHIGYRPVAVALTGGPGATHPGEWQGVRVIAEADVADTARVLGLRTVLLAGGGPAEERRAAELSEHVRNVISVHSLDDRFVEPVALRYLGSAIGIEIQNRLLMRRNRFLKRATDIVLATGGLLLSLPIVAIAAVAIAWRDPGRWWHAQVREGVGGRPFRMWKLRTMYLDADERLRAHLTADPRAREEWHREFKLADDPRVLPGVGALLRRWSLDECPQFWNVLRGDMSLVGPRALPLYHLEAFGPAFRARRQRVRPGMTGMWQVMSRGTGAIATQEALDSYYICNWSLWMDAFLLAKTVEAVVSGRGAR